MLNLKWKEELKLRLIAFPVKAISVNHGGPSGTILFRSSLEIGPVSSAGQSVVLITPRSWVQAPYRPRIPWVVSMWSF